MLRCATVYMPDGEIEHHEVGEREDEAHPTVTEVEDMTSGGDSVLCVRFDDGTATWYRRMAFVGVVLR